MGMDFPERANLMNFVNEMVFTIESLLGMKIRKEFVDSPPGDVQKTHADITKAENELGHIPKVKLTDGISNCIEWCKKTQI